MKCSAILLIALASLFSLFTAANAQSAAVTDEQARKLATDAVAKATMIAANELTTKRREDLEDALFSFQRKIVGYIRKGALFYDVVNGGYQITPDEVTYRKPTQRWLVAVSTEDGATFGLEGFTDGDAAFGRLMSKAAIEVQNDSQAEAFTTFYLSAVYGSAENVVYDELRLRQKVEEHFVGYADSQEPLARKEQRYRTWWSGFKARKAGPLAPSAQAEENGRYRVLVRILGMTIGEPPELSEWSVHVQSNGSCEVRSKNSIYPVVEHGLDNSHAQR
jgi:hypothetical protein